MEGNEQRVVYNIIPAIWNATGYGGKWAVSRLWYNTNGYGGEWAERRL